MAALAGLLGGTLWVRAQMSDTRQISTLLPSGALLYLEAEDFHHLLTEWNRSGEKGRWLHSKNFEELSQSRLLQRLAQAGGEFERVAGTPIEMSFTDQVTGSRSGFAFYDLSSLSFVYLTEMGERRIDATALWRNRANFQSREAAGIPFFVKTDEQTKRSVAFAEYKGWFVMGTDADRMAATLALLSGAKAPSVANETWFVQAAGKQQTAGALRLVYNMTALLATPQFRTYWLHRNASELRLFSSGIADLYERENGFEEQRVMVRRSEAAPVKGDGSVAEAMSYAPTQSALARGWSMPDSSRLGDALQQVIAGEQAASLHLEEFAPGVTPEAGDVGSENDLEILIDEPPFRRPSETSLAPVVEALVAMGPTALAHIQTTSVLRDQVFVMPSSGVVVMCRQPDRAALDRALATVSNPLQTGSLDPLQVAVDGHAILLSRMELKRDSASFKQLAADVSYAAIYHHAAEWPRYKRLFSVLDRTAGVGGPGASPNTPSFFSGNVQSLGDSLSRLQSASITSADAGATVRETVQYQLAKP